MLKLKSKLDDAFHSYKIYLECVQVFNNDSIKLSLLKWPDIAQSAIECLENSGDVNILINDLDQASVIPIQILHECVAMRIEEVTKHKPVIEIDISSKNGLIDSINNMFITLNVITGIKYPKIDKFNST